MIKTIKEYKDSKYELLFKNLNSRIRNSISHEDFYISKKTVEITFYEKDVAFLTLNKKGYEKIFNELENIQIGFDIARWDLTKEFEYDLIERLELVSKYMDKKGLKLQPSKTSEISAYDISEMIKKKII